MGTCQTAFTCDTEKLLRALEIIQGVVVVIPHSHVFEIIWWPPDSEIIRLFRQLGRGG